MNLTIFQKGFNYSQDGAGNRLVYHLQGCNLHCPWCSNPEGIDTVPPLIVDERFLYDSLCPFGAIQNGRLDRSKCGSCRTKECVRVHHSRAIVCRGTEYETEELAKEARKSRPLFFDSGGVTLTGGEPTLQFGAVRELLEKLKESEIHTAVETNATSPRLPELFPLIDQLIIDYKHSDGETLKKITGASKSAVETNIRAAIDSQKTVNIRIPLIGGFNTAPNVLQGFSDFFSTLNPLYFTLEILPFHEYGKDKWKTCGLPYSMDSAAHVSAQTVKNFETAFSSRGFCVIHT